MEFLFPIIYLYQYVFFIQVCESIFLRVMTYLFVMVLIRVVINLLNFFSRFSGFLRRPCVTDFVYFIY